MKYHIALARKDVIGKLGDSCFPYFLDDFNEPCRAVIVKKRTGTPSFCTLLIQVLLLGSNGSTFFLIYFCQSI